MHTKNDNRVTVRWWKTVDPLDGQALMEVQNKKTNDAVGSVSFGDVAPELLRDFVCKGKKYYNCRHQNEEHR